MASRAIPRGGVGGSSASPRNGTFSTEAPTRNGAMGTTAQARNDLTGAMAVARPGSENQPTHVPGEVTDPQLMAKIQQALPGLLAHAPNFTAAGRQAGMLQDQWLTQQLRQAGVLQANQSYGAGGGGHVLQEQGFWDKYKWPLLSMAGVAGGGLLAGALAPGLTGGAGAAAASPWEIGPTTAANFTEGALGPSTAASMAGTDAALMPPAAISGAGTSAAGATAGAGAAASGIGAGVRAGLTTAAHVAAPLAALALSHGSGSGSGSGGAGAPMDPDLLAQMKQLLALSQQRLESQQPVHEAAMRLAMNMAPTGAYSPGMANAIQQTGSPQYQGAPMSPNVLAAIQHLTGGR